MDKMSTTFQEKLERLMGESSIAEVAQAAKLPWQTVGDALKKGHVPRAPSLVRIAAVFNVSPTWLVSDDEDWPPKNPAQVADDKSLVAEAVVRYRREAERVANYLDEVEKIDWSSIGQKLADGDQDGEVVAALRIAVVLHRLPRLTFARFDSVVQADLASGLGFGRNEGGSSGKLYNRIEAIFTALTPNDSARMALMNTLSMEVFEDSPEATIEAMEEAISGWRKLQRSLKRK